MPYVKRQWPQPLLRDPSESPAVLPCCSSPALAATTAVGDPWPSFLQDSFRVIVFDNRDSGLSQRAQTPYAIRDMAEDAVGVLGELGIARTHVVGYSMGGAIAQEIAIEFPHIVDRLTLLATYDAGGPKGFRPCSGASPP